MLVTVTQNGTSLLIIKLDGTGQKHILRSGSESLFVSTVPEVRKGLNIRVDNNPDFLPMRVWKNCMQQSLSKSNIFHWPD